MPINVLQAQIQVTAPGAAQAANQVTTGLQNIQQQSNRTSTSLTNLQRSVSAFGGGVRNASSQLSGLNSGLNTLSHSASGANNTLRTTGDVSRRASGSLIDLGRIVQDAPFGFIGFANNLGPAYEGLLRLIRTSGSAGAAFRALGGALIGPAGIGFAISTISSLLITFGDRLFGGAKKLDQTKIAADEFKFALDALGDELDRFRSKLELSNELSKLRNELAGLKGGALAVANVTDDIKTTAGDISGSTTRIAPKVQELNQTRIALQGVADEFDRLKKSGEKNPLIEGTNLRGDVVTKPNPAIGQAKSLKNFAIAAKEFIQFGKVSEEVLKGLNKEQRLQIENALELKKTVDEVAKSIGKSQDKQLINAEKLKLANKQSTEDQIENNKKAADEYARFVDATISKAKELKAFFGDEIKSPVFNIFSTKEEQFKAAREFVQNVTEELGRGFSKLTAIQIPLMAIPSTGVGQLSIAQSLTPDDDKKRFDDETKRIGKLQEGFVKLGQSIAGFVTPAITAMLDAIAQGQNVFKAFGRAVVQIFQQVIAKLIQTAILASIISVISGGVGNVKNGGLSFIQAFKNVFGGFRAAGGPVGSGQAYVVGERGPEIFRPNTAGNIIPNSQMGSFAGVNSGGGQQRLVARVSGNDLLFILTQAGLSQGRLT